MSGLKCLHPGMVLTDKRKDIASVMHPHFILVAFLGGFLLI